MAWWAMCPCILATMLLPSSTTPLTTVDQGKDLEAYVYIPTERTGQIKMGLPIDLLDNSGNLIEKTKIDFVSAQVDMSMQGILVKAPVHSAPDRLRNAQLVKARVIWTTSPDGGCAGSGCDPSEWTDVCLRSQAAERPLLCHCRPRSRWATRSAICIPWLRD